MLKLEDITKDMFQAYVEVQQAGVTNMLDTTMVVYHALEIADVALTREEVRYIISNYTKLNKRYNG